MYDAILIPGGGVQEDGTPAPWVRPRLDKAASIGANRFITLSAGTVHKPPPRSATGFPVYECVAGAQYLIECGIDPERVLTECCSWDTIGNAYFSRVIHVEPLQMRNLLVVTSEFHMARTEAIFRWVYGVSPPAIDEIEFMTVANVGLDGDALRARRRKEANGLKSVRELADAVQTLSQLHRWLYSEHDAYRVDRFTRFVDDTEGEVDAAMGTY